MQELLALLIRLLEVMFALGIAGSCVVLLLTFVEDLRTLLGSD